MFSFPCSCNRYDAQRKAGQFLNERKQEVLRSCKDWDQMSKFLHYHERYMEHINSYQVYTVFVPVLTITAVLYTYH